METCKRTKRRREKEMRKSTRKTQRRTELLPVYELIFEISKYFDSTCEGCLTKMRKPKSGFVLHHLDYVKGEKMYKDFSSRLKYYQYMTKIVKKRIKQGNLHTYLAFLCNKCHHSLDGPRGMNRRKKMNMLRLINLWFRTKT